MFQRARGLAINPEDVPGFTTIALLLLLYGGIQLISIGIIGEYVARIYDETKGRPTFISRSIRRSDADDTEKTG